MKDKQLRDIELGPRQLYLFELEIDASADQEHAMTCLAGYIEMHGQADLETFIQSAVDTLGMPDYHILQHLFWLAHDLKIHFRSNEENIPPNEAKKILLESPEPDLQVVLNKPVDKDVFHSVQQFFKQITGGAGFSEYHDQTEFARRLAREIRDWKSALESCRGSAQQPGFPGERDIDAGLDFIHAISVKLDAFSLIHAFFENSELLTRLVKSVKTLSAFYANHAERWQMLVQFADASQKTLSGHIEDPSVASAYQRLNLILSSSQPYDRVDEAWQLLKTVKTHHDKIVAQETQQCREAAISSVEFLIRDMKMHLEAHGADDDLCNQSLYALRMKIKNINAAKTIDRINRHVRAAEEAFEVFSEEVADE